MKTSQAIAIQLKTIYNGGNMTGVAMKEVLDDITWQEATHSLYDCNTIGTLLYHTQYYIRIISQVLKGGPLEGNDALSFDHPPIASAAEWAVLKKTVFREIEEMAILIQQLPEKRLWEDFAGGKYGNYYRNLHGVLEHTTYHLGQMALLKKIIRQQ
ncbi:DUF1572 domain-containing protein [Dokdonia sinensis]|uniref:DUF1572 domain-containing protein n=1 Tax=Dokdonia sinensis TaxID=2479847 RepID=A0A3M0GGB5_9FLAO|nr:DUF1572 domain-containing protein [Dokdonia sinensis]RMB63975.1 DUF1572 domain-containing protein [Dokdonia sinensis]